MYLQSIGWKIYHAGMSFNSTYFLAYSISKIMLKVKKNGKPASKKKTYYQPNLHFDKIQPNCFKYTCFLSLDYTKKIKIYATGKKMETLLAVQRCPFCLT